MKKMLLTLRSRILTLGILLGIVTSTSIVLTASADPTNCAPPPAGMVSWWRGEGNALDQTGGNNGVLLNGVGFEAGVVGQAFRFDGSSHSYVEVADSPALRLTNAVTVECWAKRLNTSEVHILVDKGGDWTGGQTDYHLGLNDAEVGSTHFGFSFAGGWRGCAVTPDTAWHHYAAVAVNGQANPILYVDGVPQAIAYGSGPAAMNLVASSSPLYIGAQVDPQTGWFKYSSTVIDEPAIYNRALSAAEIQAIYSAGSAGKCPPSEVPSIITQPVSLTVVVGSAAAFTVTAVGTPPLSYQWSLNGTNIAGATATSLMLTNVQLADAGVYSVIVTNTVGTATSSNATLTVNVPPPCAPPPADLVSWWRGEGAASDSAGTNNGLLEGSMSFAAGEVGQAFSLNGDNADVRVPASPSLNVGAGAGLTFECWIKPAALADAQPVVEWNSGAHAGLHLWVSLPPPFGGGSGSIYVNLVDTAGTFHTLTSGGGILNTNGFQHVALSYDRSSGATSLYCNGALVASQSLGSFTPQTSVDLYLGKRVSDAPFTAFQGLMDEASLYSRALSAAEIQALCTAGSAGKCMTPTVPVIYSQPTNQTVIVGGTTTFTVAAGGTPPLSYQWQFNGTNLAGASGASLTLSNVQFAQAGNYAVWVTNAFGSILSSNAFLTVNPPPPCVPPPSGLVAWWQAEGNALDSAGTNTGVLQAGAGFAAGEVGQGFNFTGGSRYVQVSASPSWAFDTNEFSIELWAKFASLGGSRALIACDQGGGVVNKWILWLNDGQLQLHLNGPAIGPIYLGSGSFNPVLDRWHHVAVTRSGSVYSFYVDGTLNSTTISSVAMPNVNAALTIGQAEGSFFMGGFEDEIAIYNRALSGAEVVAIHNAGSAGKCGLAAVILGQMQDKTVVVGASVSFSPAIGGTSPLNYQWQFNGTDIAGATGAVLTLTNVQFAQAGHYAVWVTNALGSVLSSNALLTVNPPPPCVPPPLGLVGWWRGESNAWDQVGLNPGTLTNGAGFGVGEVGQAFNLNGTSKYVNVPSSASLNPTNSISVEAWINPRLPLNGVASPIIKKAGEGSASQNGYTLELSGTSGVRFGVYLNGGRQWVLAPTAPLYLNKWSHVVGVFNGTNVAIYMNGALAWISTDHHSPKFRGS